MSAEPVAPGLPRASIDEIGAVAARAGWIWIHRRWPDDDRAIAAVVALVALCRPPRGRLSLPADERAARIRVVASRAAERLAALSICPAMDRGQRDEVAAIAAALRAAARS